MIDNKVINKNDEFASPVFISENNTDNQSDNIAKKCNIVHTDSKNFNLNSKNELVSFKPLKDRISQAIGDYVKDARSEDINLPTDVVSRYLTDRVNIQELLSLYDKVNTLFSIGLDRKSFDLRTPGQQESIISYGSQMLRYGYKEDFIKDVCNQMINLYEYTNDKGQTLENLLRGTNFDELDSFDKEISESDCWLRDWCYREGEFAENSKKSENLLSESSSEETNLDRDNNPDKSLEKCSLERKEGSPNYHDEGGSLESGPENLNSKENLISFVREYMAKNGGDYGLVEKYHGEQVGSSWSSSSVLYKSFCLSTIKDLSQDQFYLPEVSVNVSEKFLKNSENNNEKSNSNDNLTERVKNIEGEKDYLEYFEKMHFEDDLDKKKYVNTMTTYRAFTAIVLNSVENIPGFDKEKCTLQVYRTMRGYAPGIPQGISESTSLESFNADVSAYVQGGDNLTIRVPLCDVYGLYLVSKLGPTMREVNCNLSHADVHEVVYAPEFPDSDTPQTSGLNSESDEQA